MFLWVAGVIVPYVMLKFVTQGVEVIEQKYAGKEGAGLVRVFRELQAFVDFLNAGVDSFLSLADYAGNDAVAGELLLEVKAGDRVFDAGGGVNETVGDFVKELAFLLTNDIRVLFNEEAAFRGLELIVVIGVSVRGDCTPQERKRLPVVRVNTHGAGPVQRNLEWFDKVAAMEVAGADVVGVPVTVDFVNEAGEGNEVAEETDAALVFRKVVQALDVGFRKVQHVVGCHAAEDFQVRGDTDAAFVLLVDFVVLPGHAFRRGHLTDEAADATATEASDVLFVSVLGAVFRLADQVQVGTGKGVQVLVVRLQVDDGAG